MVTSESIYTPSDQRELHALYDMHVLNSPLYKIKSDSFYIQSRRAGPIIATK